MLNNFIKNILDKIQGNSWGEGYVVYSKDIYERPIPFSKTIRRNNMKKAILVNDYASVEELNKLFDEGYTVESLDDRGVYILKRDKKQPTTLIACNGSMVDGSKIKHATKQPHVRIEFDDIRDAPDVWIDGVKIGLSNDKPLISLNIDWKTNGLALKHKQFDISYIDLDEDGGTRKGIRGGSLA